MSWLQKLLPPKIQRTERGTRKTVPEGLWTKCPACDAVLYSTDLREEPERMPEVRPPRAARRARRASTLLLDTEGRFEIGAEVLPVDSLKFKD